MIIGVFGGRRSSLSPNWSKESVISLFAGSRIDASAGAGPGATVTIVSLFGSTELVVPPGSRITEHGFSLLGGRRVDVRPGDGPEITVHGYSAFGSLKVTEGSA